MPSEASSTNQRFFKLISEVIPAEAITLLLKRGHSSGNGEGRATSTGCFPSQELTILPSRVRIATQQGGRDTRHSPVGSVGASSIANAAGGPLPGEAIRLQRTQCR